LEGVFFASVSLSPSDKEMKCRHAQWLIVIKRAAKTERAKAQKAATRQGTRPQNKEQATSNPQEHPIAAVRLKKQGPVTPSDQKQKQKQNPTRASTPHIDNNKSVA
jgi:hypothetical protein